MPIVISTAYEGEHKDYHISDEELRDQMLLDEALAEVEEYLEELDESNPYPFNDGLGPFTKQLRQALFDVLEGVKPRASLVMAVDDATDITVDIALQESD